MRLALLSAVLALGACASLSAEKQALDANLANVTSIVEQNERFLATDARAAALKAPDRSRNAAAVDLARALVEKATK